MQAVAELSMGALMAGTCHPALCHSPNVLFTALTRELPVLLWWWINFLWQINHPVPHCNTLQNALPNKNCSLTYKSWCISFLHPRQNNGPSAPPSSSFSLEGELSLIAKWKVERVKSSSCMTPLMYYCIDFKLAHNFPSTYAVFRFYCRIRYDSSPS